MDETMKRIKALAEEHQALYEKISHGGHSTKLVDRLHEIEGQLAMLWNQHRTEVAISKGGWRGERPR